MWVEGEGRHVLGLGMGLGMHREWERVFGAGELDTQECAAII